MREDAKKLEENRLQGIEFLDDYTMVHERHRIFPGIFEKRKQNKILELSAGVGIIAKKIKTGISCNLLCNEVDATCLRILKKNGLKTISFDLDNNKEPFPLASDSFDTVITLATIEHIIHIDHFVQEIHRILYPEGYLYISAPNYNGLLYVLPLLFQGKTFHSPVHESSKYEFYAHVRYFTFRSLMEYIESFGFQLETVYLPLPQSSTHYLKIKKRSRFLAFCIRLFFRLLYMFFSPRWASEPILCFQKTKNKKHKKFKKKLV